MWAATIRWTGAAEAKCAAEVLVRACAQGRASSAQWCRGAPPRVQAPSGGATVSAVAHFTVVL